MLYDCYVFAFVVDGWPLPSYLLIYVRYMFGLCCSIVYEFECDARRYCDYGALGFWYC